MKESVIDVLMYLFERYADDDHDVYPDREGLQSRLIEAGFSTSEIEKAFKWLDELSDYQQKSRLDSSTPASFRLYHVSESERIDRDCRGFLMFLEHTGVLTPTSRELVIDRIMALDTDELDLEQLKWIVLMVLMNLPGAETAYSWMEGLVFNESTAYLH
jgi:Smg protein